MTHETWISILKQPKAQRITNLQDDFWLDLTQQTAILKKMDALFGQPQRQRPSCMLLLADSGMGKTSMLKEFGRRHKPTTNEVTGVTMRPIVSLELPVPVDINILLRAILKASGCPISGHRLEDLFDYCQKQLKRLGIRVLVIDEIQRLSLIPSKIVTWQVCESIKRISSNLKIPVVVAGTYTAHQYFTQDDQLARRFKVQGMPNWKLDQDFQTLVKSVLTYMPVRDGFEANICTHPSVLEHLLEASENTTDGLLEHIRNVTIMVLEQGREYLTVKDMKL